MELKQKINVSNSGSFPSKLECIPDNVECTHKLAIGKIPSMSCYYENGFRTNVKRKDSFLQLFENYFGEMFQILTLTCLFWNNLIYKSINYFFSTRSIHLNCLFWIKLITKAAYYFFHTSTDFQRLSNHILHNQALTFDFFFFLQISA